MLTSRPWQSQLEISDMLLPLSVNATCETHPICMNIFFFRFSRSQIIPQALSNSASIRSAWLMIAVIATVHCQQSRDGVVAGVQLAFPRYLTLRFAWCFREWRWITLAKQYCLFGPSPEVEGGCVTVMEFGSETLYNPQNILIYWVGML